MRRGGNAVTRCPGAPQGRQCAAKGPTSASSPPTVPPAEYAAARWPRTTLKGATPGDCSRATSRAHWARPQAATAAAAARGRPGGGPEPPPRQVRPRPARNARDLAEMPAPPPPRTTAGCGRGRRVDAPDYAGAQPRAVRGARNDQHVGRRASRRGRVVVRVHPARAGHNPRRGGRRGACRGRQVVGKNDRPLLEGGNREARGRGSERGGGAVGERRCNNARCRSGPAQGRPPLAQTRAARRRIIKKPRRARIL